MTSLAQDIRESMQIVRPSWAVGITNAELVAVARQEGRNPHQVDWYDRIDSKVIQELRDGAYRHANTRTVSQTVEATKRATGRKDGRKSTKRTERQSMPKMTPDQAITFNGFSEQNTVSVLEALAERGCDCQPYLDVFTFGRWIAQGYGVRKGEHAIRIPKYTAIQTGKLDENGEPKVYLKLIGTTCVFCRHQVTAKAA